MDRDDTISDKAILEDPKSVPRGGQERSKGQPEKIARAPRAPREARRGPQQASQEGLKRAPGSAPRKAEEAPKAPKAKARQHPKKEKAQEECRRCLRKSPKSGAKMAPRGAPRRPGEVPTRASKLTPEKPFGRRRAPTGRQDGLLQEGPRALQDGPILRKM